VKVLLIKDVKTLGRAGEIKDVKDGYGQNFLIGKGFAKLATPEVIENYKAELVLKEKLEKEEIERLNKEKKELEAKNIIIKKHNAPVGIQGSVGNTDIAIAIKEQFGFECDKKSIHLDKPIKSTGIHEVDLKLGHGIHAKPKVEVVGIDQ
jgi:large subunit ribosomal protein L9